MSKLYFLFFILGLIIISGWCGSKVGWYLFFTPSSMQDAKQIIEDNQCKSITSSFIGTQLKCQSAYEYIKKNTM